MNTLELSNNQKVEKVKSLISEAEKLLEEARTISGNLSPEFESFSFGGPAYGMGGELDKGKWRSSSELC